MVVAWSKKEENGCGRAFGGELGFEGVWENLGL